MERREFGGGLVTNLARSEGNLRLSVPTTLLALADKVVE